MLLSTLVSKEHLSLNVTSDGVILTVLGGLTTVGDELIDQRALKDDSNARCAVRTLKDTTKLIIGRNGVKVWIVRKDVHIKLPRDLLVNEDMLESVGVTCSFDLHSDTTHLVTNLGKLRSSSVLEAMIQQIPIMNEQFITALIECIPSLESNFEANWPDVAEYLLEPQFKPTEQRTTMLSGLLFIFFDDKQFEYLEPVLRGAKAESQLYEWPRHELSDIVTFIKSFDHPMSKTVLIKQAEQNYLKSMPETSPVDASSQSLMSSAALSLGCFIVTTDDVFESVKSTDVNILFKSQKRPMDEETEAVKPTKKARRTTRVKPLDSLDFFAGGGKNESPPQSLNVEADSPAIQEKQTTTTTTKRSRSRVQKLDNAMLDTFSPVDMSVLRPVMEIADSEDEGLIEPEGEGILVPSENVLLDEDEISVGTSTTISGNVERVAETEPQRSTKRPLEASPKEQQSFSSAVIQAKRRANERFTEDSNVDTESTEHLRDLAIVEEVPIPMRDLSINTIQTPVQPQSQWKDRKNFKTFVKNTKGGGDGRGFQNLSCLKEYVQFNVYDPSKDLKVTKMDEAMLDAMEAGNVNEQQHLVSIRNISPVTGDDEQSVQAPQHEKLFVDDDSDDDDNGFQFSTMPGGGDGLGMDVNAAPEDRVPEFRRLDTSLRAPSAVGTMQTPMAPPSQASVQPTMQRPVDDSDSDDDEPRFKFNR